MSENLSCETDMNNSLTAAAPVTRQRKEKVPFVIDFESPNPHDTKKLFETGTKAATTLPAPKTTKRKIVAVNKKGKKVVEQEEVDQRNDHLLPNDMHFSSRQLLRLFLKPKFTVSWIHHGASPLYIPS